MNMREYQEKALSFALPSAKTLHYLIPGLCGEAGEVASVFAKQHRDYTPFGEMALELQKELGDILWFVAVTASHLDLSLEDIAQINIDKLESRKARNVIGGSGNDR